MVIQTLSKSFTTVFGSRNDRLLKQYARQVREINELEAETQALTDAQLRDKTESFRERVNQGERARDFLPQIMAVAREAMDRSVGIRSIFNPAFEFDTAQLPAALQEVYAQIKAQGERLEPDPIKGGEPAAWWLRVEVPNALYDAVRELYPLSKPPFRARPFDVQLIGGMVLGEGKIAEMKTGEGKTIVAPLACYVACVDHLQCHVVTTNDYLVQRDRDWVFPFYHFLGLTVGAIHPMHQQPPQLKAEAYQCDVLYATNSELGFDYLRDNMKLSTEEQLQKRRDFVIVDEIDSILIDEARTPLIISGPAHDDAPRYDLADQIARHLVQKQREWDACDHRVEQCEMRLKGLEGDIRNARDKTKIPPMRAEIKELQAKLPQLEADRDQHTQYYEIEIDRKAAHLTHDGIAEAQKQAGIGSFYVGNNMDFPHLLENALRAHAVYQCNKDYVVKDGQVVIVDEFTGRLMIGRQWSDGLHQAIESKETVEIKQETQTLATVTIQNFFKLYKRLAGMTGTAITESTEFMEIYDLEVVCIPTNVPVIRHDREDLIFLSSKDKKNAIVDEIKRVHDLGRPILVGTTSVERSEELSQMLTKRHGIKHEVLNAKIDQAEREGNLVADAGKLGAVMIATNMAGRGTDIKLQSVAREDLVDHWKRRDLLPKQATADMGDEELIARSYRHQAINVLGISKKDAQAMSDEQLKLSLFRHWCEQDAYIDAKKASSMNLEACVTALNKLPDYAQHRMEMWSEVEQMGGLHIVGTERHESRRIDNQLRGRSGRQGNQGSSRFFISLEDDLMKMFAGKTTMTALSRLGMKEGDAIEHRWVTKSVERAQRKVEERNYEVRKSLLEYDEVMEHQRGAFYGIRQDVLEGRDIDVLIFDYIEDAVADAASTYLDKDYLKTQAAEWCRQTLDVSIEPGRLHLEDMDQLQDTIRKAARSEVQQVIDVTLGEYMSNDIPVDDWDFQGLRGWAMSRFDVDLKMNRLREMNVDQVAQLLTEAAYEQIDKKDLSPIVKYLEPFYAQKELATWAKKKFGLQLDPETLATLETEQVIDQILKEAREAYARREITYPVEFNLELVFQGAQQDQAWATQQLIEFAHQRYELNWTPENLAGQSGQDLHQQLTLEAEQWLKEDGKLQHQVQQQVEALRNDPDQLNAWITQRFGSPLEQTKLEQTDDLQRLVYQHGRAAMRTELSQLERFVLLQILDQTWKDHLYSMDQLKSAVGLRGYAEKDPRIEYKREGSHQFQQMQQTLRDRTTDLIFHAKLTPNVQLRNAYGDQQTAQHQDSQSAIPHATSSQAARSAGQGTAVQREDLRAAEQAGSRDDGRPMTRKQRRATEARERRDKPASRGASRKRRR